MLCSIYRYEAKHNGTEGVNVSSKALAYHVEMNDELGDEVKGIPKSIGLPYYQICKRMGRSIPHLTFFDQSSYNLKVQDPTSINPYVGRFDNTDLRWPMFGDSSEIVFLKGCADTSGVFGTGRSSNPLTWSSFIPTRTRCNRKLSRACYEREQRGFTTRAHQIKRDP
jgi:hypothetical protein